MSYGLLTASNKGVKELHPIRGSHGVHGSAHPLRVPLNRQDGQKIMLHGLDDAVAGPLGDRTMGGNLPDRLMVAAVDSDLPSVPIRDPGARLCAGGVQAVLSFRHTVRHPQVLNQSAT